MGITSFDNANITMPKLLLQNAEKWKDKAWMRKKEFGIWRQYSWAEGYEAVKNFCLGLICIGFERGDMMAILGDNDPHWFWAELAGQSLGGAVSGVHSSSSPEEVKYIVDHCDARFVVAQDQEQVDKLMTIIDQLPLVKKVIYWDTKGMRHYDEPYLISFDEVSSLGKEYASKHPGVFEEEIAKGNAEDLALIQYTSGTTGLPKGAIFNYRTLFASNEIFYSMNPVYPTDEWLSFVLPGWMAEQGLGLLGSLSRGLRMNFPEKQETVQENIREVGASLLFYPSRLWEMVASNIQNRVTESTAIKRAVYNLCLPVGYKVADAKFAGEEVNLFWRALNWLCNLIVFRPLKDRLGLLKLRYAYTSGSLLGPDIFRMIVALGLDLRQLYGSSEQGISQHTPGEIKVDSVGRLNPYTTVRIMDDNHILARGASCALGYHKNTAATQEKFAGGWYQSGDAGYMDDEGHIYYLDRLEYMAKLADGTRFAPQYIEARLKFSPYIKDAFVIGDESKHYVGAIVNIDYDNVGHWAERRRIPYTTFVDLSQKAEVCSLIAEEVKKLNHKLPDGQQVRRFINMPKEFDPDEAELTRTMKLRRGFLEDRYKEIISTLYGDQDLVKMQVPVFYRDGRKAVINAEIRVSRLEKNGASGS